MGIVMAEKETDDNLEDMTSEGGSSNFTFKGLSKPTLIKIAIGLITLLIIAGAAYFFLMTTDDKTPEDVISSALTTSESVEAESESADTSETAPLTKQYTAEDIQILKMREEAVTLKEQNLQMKERLSKLEGQQDPNAEPAEPADDKTTSEDDENIDADLDANADVDNRVNAKEVVAKPKVKINPYANLYSRDSTLIRNPQTEPPPEPTWGEFDPLYRGK